MSIATQKANWPDAVRLKMIERSEFYGEPRIYQYGYYDGYQAGIESKKEMLEVLKECREWYEKNFNRLAPDTPVCFSKALSTILKAES